MPCAPPKPCAHPGCPALVERGRRYCPKHQRQERQRSDEARGTAAERGYGSRWQRASKRFLEKNKLCAECERQDRLTKATVTDHIVPHKGNQKLFWDQSNWQPLCKPCHDRKTAREDGGFGNG
ncbi:HNH endonuclease [bacterium]|nr:HNH endonuclease [bacterium]